jgi:hypothetical protein
MAATGGEKKVVRCQCGKRLRVDASLVGRRAQCPFCQRLFFVPRLESDDPFAGLRPDSSILMFWPKPGAGPAQPPPGTEPPGSSRPG